MLNVDGDGWSYYGNAILMDYNLVANVGGFDCFDGVSGIYQSGVMPLTKDQISERAKKTNTIEVSIEALRDTVLMRTPSIAEWRRIATQITPRR